MRHLQRKRPRQMARISAAEAIERLADAEALYALFEPYAGTGSHPTTVAKLEAVAILNGGQLIEESGPIAQEQCLGVAVEVDHVKHGLGVLFLQTKRERRISRYEVELRDAMENNN